MPVRKQDAHKALELLEEYRKKLGGTENEELREALSKAIVAIRSRLFQALLDIQEFYRYTLVDDSKSAENKTEETLKLAERWQSHPPPVPSEITDLAQKSLDGMDGDLDWITESIELQRGETGGLGISIAGGVDNPHMENGDPGIYITKLIPDTPAERDGRLQLGDQIISVNGITLMTVQHADAVQALKDSGKNVILVVRRKQGRMWTPISDHGTLEKRLRVEHSASPVVINTGTPTRIIDIVLIKNHKGLGFSIAGGRGNQHVLGDDGIFITKIIPDGPAEEEGTLSVGDRILQVNGESMVDISHDKAVSILKATSERVLLRIEKNAISRSSQPISTDEDEMPEVAQRKVILNRPAETGLGFNIIGGEGETGIFISFIAPGSLADNTQELNVGDQIIKVNETDLRECSHSEAAAALKGAGTVVTLVVEYRPAEFEEFQQRIQQLQEIQATSQEPSTPPGIKPSPVKQLYVRALFDHDAIRDDDCPSYGLSFKHGDVLHILNGSDEEWWQAALVGSYANDGPQGLIPSKRRVERRTKTLQKSVKFTRAESTTEKDKDRKLSVGEKRGPRASFKLSRKLPFIKKRDISSEEPEEMKRAVKDVVATLPHFSMNVEEFSRAPAMPYRVTVRLIRAAEDEEIPTYEPVTLEKRNYARPVIILGPLKEDINDMLVQEFPDKFAGCVPHTTREPRDGEVDGRDYHFVSSVEQMERDIQAHLFIEAGRYKNNLYGTSVKAVKEVAEQGKHCILGVSGYAIRRLQMADLHPIAICIRPSSSEVIQTAQPKADPNDCKLIFEKGKAIEHEFAGYFTAVVDGDSLTEIYSKVKNVVHEQSGNLIWVPSNETL